jgi:hypothetical protein
MLLKPLLHILLLSSIPYLICAQSNVIKRKITLVNEYHNNGQLTEDTVSAIEYDTTGLYIREIQPSGWGYYIFGNVIGDAKRTTIDSTADKIHYGVLRTDSAYWDEYKTIYKDSLVFYTIEDNDTIRKRVEFIIGKKTYRIIQTSKNKMFSESDTSYYQAYWDCTFERNNKLYAKTFVIRNEDTTKETKNKVFHISKVYRYYSDKNKWSLDFKEKKDRKGYYVKEINFMSGEKTKTKFKYNKAGQKIQEIIKAPTYKIIKKYTYIYEYY